MAGNALNQLGQLFVDIGVGGVGKTLKALNSISASFLLTKTAATQAIQPILKMGREASDNAVNIAKLGASLGSTRVEAQKLIWYLRKNNLSESLAGNLSSLSKQFTSIQQGFGTADPKMLMSMGMLGLNLFDYDGTSDSIFKYVKDVQNAIKQKNLSPNAAKMHLENLGLGGEWFYALQKGDFDLSKSKTYSDKVAQALIESREKANQRALQGEINAALATSKILSHGGSTVQDITNKVYEDVGTVLGEDKNAQKRVINEYKNYAQAGSKLSNPGNNVFWGFEIFRELNKRKAHGGLTSLETINDNSLYTNSVNNGVLPGLPSTAQQGLQVNVNTQIQTSDPNTQFTVLSVEEENKLTNGVAVNVNQSRNTTGL